MWYPCCMTSFCSRIFYSFFLSLVINTVTTPSGVTDVTVWQITSNPSPRVLKIEKWKIIWKENKIRKKIKKKLSLHSLILTIRILELKIVNLVFLNIFSHFYFYFYLFYYLELRVKVIVWYSYLFSSILSFQSLYRIYSSISLYIQY